MTELSISAAASQYIGGRERQEDAVIFHAPPGNEPAFAVLSDGMGGHDDGDLASRIIAREVFGELFIASARPTALQRQSVQVLRAALDTANGRLRQHISAGHISSNTGGTVVCATILEGQLRWMSVGDSSLYLIRRNKLTRLNQIHSMAAQLDKMVERGQMDAETAREHPDRSCLTSAITGGDIVKVDCESIAEDLVAGDIVILASDGLDILNPRQIRRIVRKNKAKSSRHISSALMKAVQDLNLPDQDNTSIIAIKVEGKPQPIWRSFFAFANRNDAPGFVRGESFEAG